MASKRKNLGYTDPPDVTRGQDEHFGKLTWLALGAVFAAVAIGVHAYAAAAQHDDHAHARNDDGAARDTAAIIDNDLAAMWRKMIAGGDFASIAAGISSALCVGAALFKKDDGAPEGPG